MKSLQDYDALIIFLSLPLPLLSFKFTLTLKLIANDTKFVLLNPKLLL